MAKKYYVVWIGREPGIYTDWNSCKKQVDTFPNAKFKSFKTLDEAEVAFKEKPVNSTTIKKPASTQKQKSIDSSVQTLTNEQVEKINVNTKIFSDGACSPNPGEVGSGISIYRDNQISMLWYGCYNPNGTNNTAELNALYKALFVSRKEIESNRTVAIFSDSKYSIQCITQWAVTWKSKGWTKKGGGIKNLDLIKKMFTLYQSIKDNIDVYHVNGHVGIEGNELADRMSFFAIDSKEEEFCMYSEEVDIEKVLSLRSDERNADA
jgi:ribonuclease HI